MSDQNESVYPEEIQKLLAFMKHILKRMTDTNSPELQDEYRKLLVGLADVLRLEALAWDTTYPELQEEIEQLRKGKS